MEAKQWNTMQSQVKLNSCTLWQFDGITGHYTEHNKHRK